MVDKEFRNRNVKCSGKAVIRDPDSRQAILDADGARQWKPCENYAANNTDFCQFHGGSTPSTVIAARRRLLYGAEDLVEILMRIAKDETAENAERIRAINSFLDRAGIRAGVDINTEVPKWQSMLGKVFGAPDPEKPASPPGWKFEMQDTDRESKERDRVNARAKAEKEAPKPRQRKASRPAVPDRPKFEGW